MLALRAAVRVFLCVRTAHTIHTYNVYACTRCSCRRLNPCRPALSVSHVALPSQLPNRYDQDAVASRQILGGAIAPGHVSGVGEQPRRSSPIWNADFRDIRDLQVGFAEEVPGEARADDGKTGECLFFSALSATSLLALNVSLHLYQGGLVGSETRRYCTVVAN